MPADDPFGSLAEEYHVASRNPAAFKHVYRAYETHYQPHVQHLMATAPLHLEDCPRVPLPPARAPVPMSVEEAITRRVSGRRFRQASLAPEELATLLYLAAAVRHVREEAGTPFYQRNVPNSGNLGSVEVYPVVLNVTGIEPGIYHFDSVRHDLARLRAGDYGTWLQKWVFLQLEFSEAAAALILTGAVGRLSSKYGLRGYRLALIDVGHVSENLYLTGTGLGLQVCATAGFIDDELDRALGLDGLETAALLVVLVGPA